MLYKQGVVQTSVVHSSVVHSRCCTNEVAPLQGPVYDDTGGDENNPEGNASDYVSAQEEEAVPDSDKVRIEEPKDVKHGDTIPTPDEAEVGNVRFLMPKISILARRGGGHNETRGCAHFILVAKAALLFPRSPG